MIVVPIQAAASCRRNTRNKIRPSPCFLDIVAELGHAVDRIGEVRDAVQGIRGIDRLLPQRIDDAAQPPRRIQHPLGGRADE